MLYGPMKWLLPLCGYVTNLTYLQSASLVMAFNFRVCFFRLITWHIYRILKSRRIRKLMIEVSLSFHRCSPWIVPIGNHGTASLWFICFSLGICVHTCILSPTHSAQEVGSVYSVLTLAFVRLIQDPGGLNVSVHRDLPVSCVASNPALYSWVFRLFPALY